MSHVVTGKTLISADGIPELEAACRRLGYEFLEGQKTYQWYGRWWGW